MRLINFILCGLTILLASCGVSKIHFTDYNPEYPGKTPKFSHEIILLGELTPLRSCYDVHFYDLSIEVNPATKSLKGTVLIYASAVTDFDSLQIDLAKNFTIKSLTDNSNGEVLPYVRDERAVFISYKQAKDQQFVLKVDYEGIPVVAKKAPWYGGFVWKKDKDGKPWIGVACESDGASIWWPCKDHTSDEADSVTMHYTVPNNIVAVANGQLMHVDSTANQKTYTWHVSYPINTYNITFYGGNFKLLNDEYTGIDGRKLALNHFVLPYNFYKAKDHFQQVKPIIKSYEENFGVYPWYRDGFKLVESPYAGMEHQTAIAYGNGYKNDLDSITDYIILHEAAHEWWGNAVTASDFCDIWLQEGFATFAESLFLRTRSGDSIYYNHLFFDRLFIQNEYSVVGWKDRRWFDSDKCGDVYMKGAWILQTLRNQMQNDSVFFDILKTFYSANIGKLVATEDFISLVNQKTGSDYHWFFNQYLNHNQVPELEFIWTPDGKLKYRWLNVEDDFYKLRIDLTYNKKKLSIYPSTSFQQVYIPSFSNGKRTNIQYNRYSLFKMH